MEQDGDMKEEEHGKRGKAVRESVSFILYLIVIATPNREYSHHQKIRVFHQTQYHQHCV